MSKNFRNAPLPLVIAYKILSKSRPIEFALFPYTYLKSLADGLIFVLKKLLPPIWIAEDVNNK